MRIIDLAPGLGARAIAFQKVGFQVVYAAGDDVEDAKIYDALVHPQIFDIKNIAEIDPRTLPEADIIMARLVTEPRVKYGDKKAYLRSQNNGAVNYIICTKRPAFFILEAPVIFLYGNNRVITEEVMADYINSGYSIFYNTFTEEECSRYPVRGNHLFFIGIKNYQTNREFYFEQPDIDTTNRKLKLEAAETVNGWYRNVRFKEGTKYIQGSFYVRIGGTEKRTDRITEGFLSEMYLVDSLGLRRFTHNEIAWAKGIEGYNFNACSNKRSMYRKLVNVGSVFIAEVVARSVWNYAGIDNYGWQEKYEPDENSGWEEVEYPDKILPEPPEVEEKKDEKPEPQNVIFPKQRITKIHINTLKGLKNLDLPIEQNLTAIMGVNGCGKSTILHALACAFKPYKDGNDYKFSFFFTPNPDSDWKNSSLEVTYFDENEKREITRTYKKNQDRWSPRYTNRPTRDVFFVGIDTCIPEIEREKQTSFIDYSTNSLDDTVALKVVQTAANILNKDYKSLTMHKTDKKEMLGVRTADDLTYSSLSMGAGEQRVIKILRLLYSVNSYSLILIDEIDLLLHVTALKELIRVIYEVAKKRNLQVIFTTHSLEVASLTEYVDVKYLDVTEQKTMVLRCITPDIIYKMSHVVEKPIQIYVEDLLAEVIVRRIASDLNILRYVRIIKFGASSNAYVIAASYILKQERYDNILFVLDGDVDREDEEKQKAVNKVLSGTEADHEAKVNQAVSMIKQFHLPENTAPEKHIFDMLIQMDSSNEIVGHAKRLKAVRDSHEWLDELTDRMGQSEEWTLSHIMDIVAENPGWEDYIQEVRDWLVEKRGELELEVRDEV